ncbi:MAG: DegV family protein [Actinobacteria bacterium]|nr:DegV family protein [Actinomycetota bacterium]
MNRVAIVTDSTADLPAEYYEKYNITVVPLSVVFEDKAYVDDNKDISIETFYSKLKTCKKLPTTTQPSPADFIKAYDKLLKTYESIVSIHISKKMSGTSDSAEIARKDMGSDKDIVIIDSELTTIALGLIVLKASQLAAENKPKEEILKAIFEIKTKIHTMFIPHTLEYLKKGGRIGRAKGLIASLLEIKPILTLHSGEVSQYKTTRRWNQAKNEIVDSIKDLVKQENRLIISIADADLKKDCDEMIKRLKDIFTPKELIRSKVGCIVGTHLGPAIAVAFYEDNG